MSIWILVKLQYQIQRHYISICRIIADIGIIKLRYRSSDFVLQYRVRYRTSILKTLLSILNNVCFDIDAPRNEKLSILRYWSTWYWRIFDIKVCSSISNCFFYEQWFNIGIQTMYQNWPFDWFSWAQLVQGCGPWLQDAILCWTQLASYIFHFRQVAIKLCWCCPPASRWQQAQNPHLLRRPPQQQPLLQQGHYVISGTDSYFRKQKA